METKVPFVCVDMPEANELTIHIMAAMAQFEAKRISERTKDALRAAKGRGVKLGKQDNLLQGNQQRSRTAKEFAVKLEPILLSFIDEGLTQRQMLERLNSVGIKTANGCSWHLITLQRILKRIQSDQPPIRSMNTDILE